MRNVIKLLLGIVMTISFLTPINVFANENHFYDISSSEYYYYPVLWAVENNITTGTSENYFSPNDECTRAQVVTFLWRLSGSPLPSITENPFEDVEETSTFYNAILWAFEKGITTGISEKEFRPNGRCARGQIVTLLWRYAGKPHTSIANNPFKDINQTSTFYEAVLWATDKNITLGTGNRFFVWNSCTRAQTVTFLYRYVNPSNIIKTVSNVSLKVQANMAYKGWQKPVNDGQIAGITNEYYNIEGLKITLSDALLSLGNVSIQAHIQDIGWVKNKSSGSLIGATEQNKRIEGIKVNLTGKLVQHFDIYYRVYVQGVGWLGWTKNGELAGSTGCNRGIQAIEVDIYERNSDQAPSLTIAYTTSVRPNILLVNKKHPVSSENDPGRDDPTAKAALMNLISAMKSANLSVSWSYSGYRSYSTQSYLYNNYVARDGQIAADTYSARPGYSEHQTGLAFDLKSPNGALLETGNEVNWVAQHAHEYGFIVRYQAGKEDITGYMAEPWHLRYVGRYATEIYKSGKTLEEFLYEQGGGY